MDTDLHKFGMRLKFFYSLGGLLLGAMCIVGGCWLFLGGVTGSTTWTFKALGIAESNVTDAAPGGILFCVGLFFVIFTRFKVEARKSATYTAGDDPPRVDGNDGDDFQRNYPSLLSPPASN